MLLLSHELKLPRPSQRPSPHPPPVAGVEPVEVATPAAVCDGSADDAASGGVGGWGHPSTPFAGTAGGAPLPD